MTRTDCKPSWLRTGAALLLGTAIVAARPALADGTPAGTAIDNTAVVSFELGGTTITQSSNTVTLTVDERLDVAIVAQSPQVLVAPGETDRSLLFTVTNTGNGSEVFTFLMDSSLPGDDFNPTPAVPAIYFDTDGSGDFSGGDVAYTPGGNDPLLAPDESVNVLVVNDMPGGFPNGSTGLSQLTVTAATGSGAAGDNFPGQGDGGVDAVVGASGAAASASGEYVIADVQVTVQKSVAVLDPFGGNEPVPGATLTYSVTVEVTNGGTATNAAVRDAVPASTTFVPGSIELNAVALSDATDGDAGELDTSGAPTVVVRLGDLTQAAGIQTVTFQVTIN
ncbi:MAG: hypothetical protein OEW35_00410 [Gammaproteobacteria bacterium]|nr:hypothetical protein [Gammaproteobacteria bacterium]MDH4252964.1 hypothetical protein [Gammaproteobacteria bacterium]MDH5308350.1 hypothetical protein [Gammaproteobacteria bacterium]